MSDEIQEKKPSLMQQIGFFIADKMRMGGFDIDYLVELVKNKISNDGGISGSGEGDPELTVTPTTEIGAVQTGTSQTRKHSEWLKKILTVITPPTINIVDGSGTAMTSKTYIHGEALESEALTIKATAVAGTSAVSYIKEGDNGTAQSGGTVTVKYPATPVSSGVTTTDNTTYKFIAEGTDGGKTEVTFEIKWVFKYRTATSVNADGSIAWGNDKDYSGTAFNLTAGANSKVYVMIPSIKPEPGITALGMDMMVTNEGSTTYHNLPYTIYSVKNEDLAESSTFVVKLK